MRRTSGHQKKRLPSPRAHFSTPKETTLFSLILMEVSADPAGTSKRQTDSKGNLCRLTHLRQHLRPSTSSPKEQRVRTGKHSRIPKQQQHEPRSLHRSLWSLLHRRCSHRDDLYTRNYFAHHHFRRGLSRGVHAAQREGSPSHLPVPESRGDMDQRHMRPRVLSGKHVVVRTSALEPPIPIVIFSTPHQVPGGKHILSVSGQTAVRTASCVVQPKQPKAALWYSCAERHSTEHCWIRERVFPPHERKQRMHYCSSIQKDQYVLLAVHHEEDVEELSIEVSGCVSPFSGGVDQCGLEPRNGVPGNTGGAEHAGAA